MQDNLLYRRLTVRKSEEPSVHPALRTGRGLEIRDTADIEARCQDIGNSLVPEHRLQPGCGDPGFGPVRRAHPGAVAVHQQPDEMVAK